MTSVPNELHITINTSIPGYQKIRFNPSMIIQNSDDKTVMFNPMIQLKYQHKAL